MAAIIVLNQKIQINMKWLLSHCYNFIAGIVMALIGYFAPIKEIILVMVIVILFDLITGIWAARVQGIGIKSMKLWRTVYKLFIAIVVVSLFFAMDTEMEVIKLHKIAAWLITGFEMWSILENAAKITDHKIFRILKHFMEDKVKDTTGVDINEKI